MTIMNNEWLLEKFIDGKSDAKEINILVEGPNSTEEVAQFVADNALDISTKWLGSEIHPFTVMNVDKSFYKYTDSPMASLDVMGYRINFI